MGPRSVRAIVLGVLLAAGVRPAAGASSVHVHIQGFAFAPGSVSILVGDTVDWDNHDAASHTVTSDGGLFDSGVLGAGAGVAVVFEDPGDYPYHCAIHPGMRGTVRVFSALGPDLVVESLAVTGIRPDTREVRLVVRNAGLTAVGASRARVAYVYKGAPRTIAEVDVGSLAPGATTEQRVAWNVLGKVGHFTVRATLDVDAAVDEAIETNNSAETSAGIVVSAVPGVDAFDP